MNTTYTASFHNGGLETNGVDTRGRKRAKLNQACREHNIRDAHYCDKQEHIVKNGHHEIWIDIPPKEAYEQIFGEAFKEYNDKQKKKSRKFNSYWEKVKKSKDLVPVREALITIGNVENMPSPEVQREIYKAFLEEFQKRNPNMKVIGAYYHNDEMRNNGKGDFVKGASHLHLDYIPVAYNCNRGQKIQNSMNGALLEQGILNLEIDLAVAERKFGLRDKTSKDKKKPKKNQIEEEQKEETEENQKDKLKTRVVTNLIQWTTEQRNLLIHVAREHGLKIENPNEKREHVSTDDYILSKNPDLKNEVYALAEKLLSDIKEVDSEKELMIDWEKELVNREESANLKENELEEKAKEYNEQVQKAKEYFDNREQLIKLKQKEVDERFEELERRESFFEKAKKHASESLHKFVSKLKTKKKEVEEKNKKLDKILDEASKITDKVLKLNNSTASSFYEFADDIKFDDARLMVAKNDGQGLCTWFENLGNKFGAWLHKAQYFAKTFWNKTPDDLINVAKDMEKSSCSNLGEYINKGMNGKTISQINEAEKIKGEIPKIRSNANTRMRTL